LKSEQNNVALADLTEQQESLFWTFRS